MAADRPAAMEMVRLSGQQGVPVTVIDGKAVVGFDRPRLDQLIEWARRPRLGAAVADAADMAAKGRITVSQGAYIGRVNPDSAAARAGLRAGDVITAIARQPIHSATSVERVVARLRPRPIGAAHVRSRRYTARDDHPVLTLDHAGHRAGTLRGGNPWWTTWP